MAPKLYLTEASPPVRGVLITAAALGLELEKQELNLLTGEHLSPEFLKLNPQHTVPTLVDGDYVIWDSHAINPYLVSKYGKDDSLYPKDLKKRGAVDNRLHYNNATIFNTMKSIARPIIFEGKSSISEEGVKSMEEIYSLLNTFLEKTKFIATDNVTVADLSIIAMISSSELLIPISEDKFPKLADWVKRVKELPYYTANLSGLKKFEAMMLSKLNK